jgi:putative nucleotidyltransferase with HDIG domain
MNISTIVKRKIDEYNPQGFLAHTSKLILALCGVNHSSTQGHIERVALMAEKTAGQLRKDRKAAFFAGLLHDIGKILLPCNLFDGHDISAEEYALVKSHAQAGFKALRKFHLFTAFCAGLHHNLYKSGYGVSMEDFPKNWSMATIKKVLDISTIISICDFVDAYTHRETKIKDGSDANVKSLKDMLYEKYPEEHNVVDIVLSNPL